ncbi:MAG: type II secretion system protein [Planctomycetes bacterium]|nr:type II secretion system protein [Planctomycetota bacterium]
MRFLRDSSAGAGTGRCLLRLTLMGQPMIRRSIGIHGNREAFTLIELLVVISIISLLMSILMPSLSRARDQAKGVHCRARLHEFGTAIATYENTSGGLLPPAQWSPDPTGLQPEADTSAGEPPIHYGWTEILFSYVYKEQVNLPVSYPVQRNIDARRWEKYFICQAVIDDGVTSGHYRVYLPAWSGGYALGPDGVYRDTTPANPARSANRDAVRPKLPLIGDANEHSERGDGLGDDECSYIDAGEANHAGSDGGFNGNRFSDRHYGGTNFLYQDFHADWNTRLRKELARDFDLNGVIDIATAP